MNEKTNVVWTLWRQDDNGRSFAIDRFESETTARRRLAEFESHEHKQHYWLTEEPVSLALDMVVIRSENFERARLFYESLGMSFQKERHGEGPEHFASETKDFLFEIYPGKPAPESVRIGFSVHDLDRVVTELAAAGFQPNAGPKASPWGMRAIFKDADGHTVEIRDSRPLG